jgi:DNA-binding HxlR family transcriptional regulator
MAGYGQFCPVSMAVEVLGRRWTLLVVRELLSGSHRFNDIRRGVPNLSPSVLSQRLDELVLAGIVVRREHDYALTAAGEELRPVVEQLGVWDKRWIRGAYDDEQLDSRLLMWDIHRGMHLELLPAPQVIVAFHLAEPDGDRKTYWLVLRREEAEVCVTDPGHDVDLRVRTDVRTLTRVWMGDADLGGALQAGAIQLTGPSHLRRAFPGWLRLNVFAGVAPASALDDPGDRPGARAQLEGLVADAEAAPEGLA